MQVSFNTYKPYTQNYKHNINNNQKQNKNIQFTSGYGAEEWDTIDNPDLPSHTNAERWRNIAEGIKMMTIDQYKYAHGIYPKQPKPLFTKEEIEKYQKAFYEDVEPMDMDENLCGLTDEECGEWPPKDLYVPKREVPYEPLDDIE